MAILKRLVEMTNAERKAEALKALSARTKKELDETRYTHLTRFQVNGGYGGSGEFYKLERCLKLFDGQRISMRHAQNAAEQWRWYVIRRASPDYPTIHASGITLVAALLKTYWKTVPDEDEEPTLTHRAE